jgi:hypothetical protein
MSDQMELVCKGKVETLYLLKLILKFRIGKFAVTGLMGKYYPILGGE